MSSIFGRTILGGAAGAASGASAGASASGRVQSFASAYYQKYIATSSVKPLLHLIGGYSALHWSITQFHKHKYQTKKVHH